MTTTTTSQLPTERQKLNYRLVKMAKLKQTTPNELFSSLLDNGGIELTPETFDAANAVDDITGEGLPQIIEYAVVKYAGRIANKQNNAAYLRTEKRVLDIIENKELTFISLRYLGNGAVTRRVMSNLSKQIAKHHDELKLNWWGHGG